MFEMKLTKYILPLISAAILSTSSSAQPVVREPEQSVEKSVASLTEKYGRTIDEFLIRFNLYIGDGNLSIKEQLDLYSSLSEWIGYTREQRAILALPLKTPNSDYAEKVYSLIGSNLYGVDFTKTPKLEEFLKDENVRVEPYFSLIEGIIIMAGAITGIGLLKKKD